MRIAHDRLKRFTSAIFGAVGCSEHEAERIGHYLVEANLAGHDSHGVIRVPFYVEWVRAGKVVPNQHVKVVFENEVIAVADGQYGFGQVLGEHAMRLGIDKATKHGVAVVALRNAGHLGQIGAWPLLVARAGLTSLHWVNTSGAGILVAPFGGINRRLSANPIAAGVPVKNGEPIVLDMSACTIAEGKIKVALNKGVQVPPNCIVDSKGQPTTDPKVFYGTPPGSILSIAGHKGYGLGIVAEVLAGALTGGGCSDPKNANRLANGMLSIILNQNLFQPEDAFAAEIQRFIAWVKSAETTTPDGEILVPGEIEARNRIQRIRDGIELDETTWTQLMTVAKAERVHLESL
jgi:uncharacterized oxidoreductase